MLCHKFCCSSYFPWALIYIIIRRGFCILFVVLMRLMLVVLMMTVVPVVVPVMMTMMVSVVMMMRRVHTDDARNSAGGSSWRRVLRMNRIAVCIIVEEIPTSRCMVGVHLRRDFLLLLIVMLVRIVMSSGKIWAAHVGAQIRLRTAKVLIRS